MARTQAQLLEEINAEANRHAELTALQRNTSRVSVWGHVKQVVAFVIHTLERFMDEERSALRALIERGQVGTAAWYAEQARAFQYQHAVTLVDHRPAYASFSEQDRIVKHVAVEEGIGEQLGTIIVKAVKAGNEGMLAELSEAELQAFQAYMDKITFAGLKVEARSEAAVAVRLRADVQVDEQLIESVQGKRVDTETQPVPDALRAYLRTLPFNGLIRRSAMEDTIQSVPGVIDVRLSRLYGRNRSFVSTFLPTSGHAKLASSATFFYQADPLS